MLKLIAASESQIDDRTVATRRSHHLSQGWGVNQNWRIAGEVNGQVVEGDAQVCVQGISDEPGCVAVIRMGSQVDVVLCRGLVNALERLGCRRGDIEVG
jgi:hypothetical protein